MAHIKLADDLPGIRALFAFRPAAGEALKALAEALLRGPSPLDPAEREMIAASVSNGNGCRFCTQSHAAVARAHLGAQRGLMDQVLADPGAAAVPAKLRALLKLAELVRLGGKAVTDTAMADARQAGATDVELHDTVLIAAAFCLYNRYVDGLATTQALPPEAYEAMGVHLAKHGYK